MILVKLGGSVITNKEKVLSARRKRMDGISTELKKIREPMIIVHGGGSYGHHWSVRYGMHTRPAEYGLRGVATVKNSMVALDMMVLDSLAKNGLNPYQAPPSAFMDGNRPVPERIRELGRISDAGMVPVTYGDALWYGRRRSYILSGDRIMAHIAEVLRPRLTVFALNVDGVYSDMKSKRLIGEIGGGGVGGAAAGRARISQAGADVTGGMGRKIREAGIISGLGLTVFFVNGNRPQRIVNAVKKSRFEGTVFRGR